MVSKKMVVILLIVAIVLSAFSIMVSLDSSDEVNSGVQDFEPSDGAAQVSLSIQPQEAVGVQNER